MNSNRPVPPISRSDFALDEHDWDAIVASLPEMLFIVLPLIVLAIVFSFRGHGGDVLSSVEWSFGASILFGQSIVKLIRSMAEKGGFHAGRVTLLAAGVLVLGLVPSLVVLSMFLVQEPTPPTTLMVAAQGVLFVLSFFCFLVCAMVGAGKSPPE